MLRFRVLGFPLAAAAIALFIGAAAVIQYAYVRLESESALQHELSEEAVELNRDVAYDDGIDPGQYNKSSTSIGQYIAILNDGSVLSFDTGSFPLAPGIFPTVHLPADAAKALDSLTSIRYRYDDKSKPETWTLLGRRVQGGTVVVGLSEHDAVTETSRAAMLRSNLELFGNTIDVAARTPSRRIDNEISWAVMDDQGNLLNGLGRVPLKADAVRLGTDAASGGGRVQIGAASYYRVYSPIVDRMGRQVGTGLLFSDVKYEAAALANLKRFDIALAVASSIVLVAAAFVYWRRHDREKAQLREAFQRYFSPQVLQAILRDPTRLALGGQRREITVLFSDIRGFTAISERLPPQQLTRMLGDYFEEMAKAVELRDGVVDKFIGDAVMAFWGAPLEQDDQADRAVAAALDMASRLERLREKWVTEGLPALDIGIGINLGVATVGNFGSNSRFDYTAIGDTVNTAARLEALNKEYGSRILISESVRRQLTIHAIIRDLGLSPIRGKEQPVRVYEVMPANDGTVASVTAHEAQAV